MTTADSTSPTHRLSAPPTPARRALTGGNPFRLSGAGRVSVVGESHYQPALRKAANNGSSTGYAEAIPATAALIPEPDNRYDSNAVRVDIAGRPVGYLSRDIAGDYQLPLLELAQRGEFGWCEARITGGGDRHYGVFLLLAGPEAVIPAVAPEGMTLLDGERPVTVTKEEHHQDVLEAIGKGRQLNDSDLIASLHLCSSASGKHAAASLIEVRLDGQRVGELTRLMSERYLPAATTIVATGSIPACLASMEATGRGWQLTLLLPDVR